LPDRASIALIAEQRFQLRRFVVRETQSQVGLSIEQRRENVHGAFLAQPDWVGGKSILVVDDVATSSATLDACAEAFLTAGCRVVYGLTVSRAARPGLDANP
jgi:predicted amidophosphoribosyltransferase